MPDLTPRLNAASVALLVADIRLEEVAPVRVRRLAVLRVVRLFERVFL